MSRPGVQAPAAPDFLICFDERVMRGIKTTPELINEIISLRVNQRLSFKEISDRLSISKATISGILKPYPLSKKEICSKAREGIIKLNHSRKKNLGALSKYAQMIDVNTLTGRDKQKIAESAVLFRLCLKGFVVYSSPFDGDKADWIVENHTGKRFVIQVKWTGNKGRGLPLMDLTCTEGRKKRRYRENEFDFIVGYCLLNDTAYVYSFDELRHLKKTVTINEKYAETWEKIK